MIGYVRKSETQRQPVTIDGKSIPPRLRGRLNVIISLVSETIILK
jgi:hypothetical protein